MNDVKFKFGSRLFKERLGPISSYLSEQQIDLKKNTRHTNSGFTDLLFFSKRGHYEDNGSEFSAKAGFSVQEKSFCRIKSNGISDELVVCNPVSYWGRDNPAIAGFGQPCKKDPRGPTFYEIIISH